MIHNEHRTHELTFLFSDRDALPERLFDGFAFVGADYVFGDQGAQAFEAHRGQSITPGEDGCYVSLGRIGREHRIGVDHAGLKKIFYYRYGTTWCVSNSLVLLVEHLRGRGVPLTVNFPQLAAFKAPGTFTAQLTTPATIFNEVHLLPTGCTILVDEGGLRLVREPRRAVEPYPDALRRYVSTWTSRLHTLLNDRRMWLNVDLSGGVDSRTVFALVAAAATLSEGAQGARNRVRLRTSLSERAADDYQVATAVAERHGWELNGSLTGRPPLQRFSAAERYEAWKDLCLGVYMSVYFPDRRPSPWVIDFHGGGGENHRPFYAASSPEELLGHMRAPLPTYLGNAWKRDVLRHFDELASARPNVAPLILHYREFRNRFHGGLNAQYRTVASPLSSYLLDALSHDADKVASKQVNLDVMESLVPGLKDMPYDSPAKSPTAENLKSMSVVGASIALESGHVFAPDDSAGDNPARAARGHLELMLADFEEARRPLVEEFLGSEIVDDATEQLTRALKDDRFPHANDAKNVTRVLTTGFAFGHAEIG